MTTFEGYQLSPVQRAQWNVGPGNVLRAEVTVGDIDRKRLAYAFRVVTGRHEALRLRLAEHPTLRVPAQVVRPDVSVFVADRDSSAYQTEPLRMSLSSNRLLLTALPTALDPASLRIVLREVATLYAGGTLTQDEDRTQFLDVSEWLIENFADHRPVESTVDGPMVRRLDVLPVAELAGNGEARVADASATEVFAAWALAVSRYAPDAATLAMARYHEGRGATGTEDVVGPLGAFVPAMVPTPLPTTRTELLAVASAIMDDGPGVVVHPLERPDVAAGFAMVTPPTLQDLAPLGATAVTVDVPEFTAAPLLAAVRAGGSVTLSVRNGGELGQRLLDATVAILAAMHADAPLTTFGPAETDLITRWSGEPGVVVGRLTGRDGGVAGDSSAEADLVTPSSGGPGVVVGTLTDLLDAGIARDPSAEAVVAPDGVLTFGQLDVAATDLAVRLTDLGVGAEDRVLVLAERSWRTVAAFVGVLRAGAVYVPVDPGEPVERLRRLAGLVDARAVVADVRPGLDLPVLDVRPDPEPMDFAPPVVTGDQAAYIIFTSGSTGVPRPVVVEHSSVVNLFHGLVARVYPESSARIGVNAPLTFDSSMKQLVQLAAGRTLCLLADDVRRDVDALLGHLAAHRVDVLDCTPSHLRAILDADGRLPATLLLGGEAVDQDLWDRVAALDVRAVNLYGPTECTVDVTAQEITAGLPASIGRPLPGVRTWVLNGQLAPVPVGVAGELCVGGVQVARGYLGDDEATASRFVTVSLPDGSRDRVYRTGDLVRYRGDGTLEFLGRVDDQVKINGRRVEPGEVAATLTSHPRIAQAVVVPHDNGLLAYAVPGVGATVDIDRIAGINPHETRYLYDEIFVQQVYLRGGISLPENAVVFDVGANIGMFSLFAHAVCPTVRLHAFEPLPDAYAKLRDNLDSHGIRADLFECGLSATERDETFTSYPGYSMMSGQRSYADADAEIAVVKRFLANERDRSVDGSGELLANADDLLAERFAGTDLTVRLRRLGDVLDAGGVDRIDLLKIDVQRAELDVLNGLDDRHWPLVHQVALEVHDAPGTATEGRVRQVVDMLERHGFHVVTEQDAMLVGTDRHTVYAVRPAYRAAAPAPSLTTVDGVELRDWLAGRLPAYMVPAAVLVIPKIPLTRNGKVDRAALPTPAAEAAAVTAPEGPVERVLLDVWQEVLGRNDFGVEDPFFRFGGDSIRGIRVRTAAARRGVKFPLRHVFKYPTIRELARADGVELTGSPAETATDAPFRLLTEADRLAMPPDVQDAYPVSALQLGMLYHSELTRDRGTYHVVTAHRVVGAFDPPAALERVVAAHPVLRTGFDLGHYSEPLQLVYREVDARCPVEDLRSADESAQDARVAEVMAAERAQGFEWARPPLLRMRALRTGDEAFTLVITHYHGVLDGWSLHLLLAELLAPTAATPPQPYHRFVELERAARSNPESLAFWRTAMAGVTPTHLARAKGHDPLATPHIDALHVQPLPAGLGERLRRVADQHDVPLKSLLLAVHMRAQAEVMRRDQVVSGLVVSGRTDDRTLGLFLNTVPVRASVGGRSLVDLAAELWRTERDVMGHHLVPLADIARTAGTGPLFDVFFNFTHFHAASGARAVADERGGAVDVGFTMAVDFEVDPATGELSLSLQYDSRRLPADRVRDLAARYGELLVADPVAGLPATEPNGSASHVADVWRELTGAAPADDTARFYQAGGNSLLALRFVAVLRDRHGIVVGLDEFNRDGSFGAIKRLAVRGGS